MCTRLLQSSQVAELLRNRAQTWATQQLHQPVHIGAVALELLPPTVTLREVRMEPSAGGPYDLQVQRARVRPRPWPSSRGAPVLTELDLAGVTGSLPVDLSWILEVASSAGNAPAGTAPKVGGAFAAPKPRSVDIQRLTINDATLTLHEGDNWVTLAGITVLMHPVGATGRLVTIDVLQMAAYLPNLLQAKSPHVAGLHLQGELQGTLDHPRHLHVQTLQLHTLGVGLQVRGDIDLSATPELQLHMSLQAPLISLESLAGRAATWDGWVDVTGALTGVWRDLSWQGEVDGTHLMYDDRQLGDVRAELRWHDGNLSVLGALWQMQDGGRITGSGEWDAQGSRALQAGVRLHHVALQEVLAAAGIPHAWVRQTLQGDVHAAGTTRPFDVRLDASAVSTDFAALNQAYTLPRAKPILAIAEGQVRGTARLTASGMAWNPIAVSSGRGRVVIEGFLPFDTQAAMQLRVQTREALDLGLAGPIGGVPFTGTAQIDADVSGPYYQPAIDAHATVDDFGLLGYAIGKTRGRLRFVNSILHMENLEAEAGGGTIAGAGALRFGHPEEVPLDLALQAEGVDIRAILRSFHVSEAIGRHLHAAVSGRVLISGPAHRPSGVGHLYSKELRVDRVALGAAHLESTFGNHDSFWEGSLTTRPREGSLRLHGAFKTDGSLALSGAAEGLPMHWVGARIGSFAQEGTLEAGWELRGPADALSGFAHVRVENYSVGAVQLGGLAIDAGVRDGVLTGNGHVGEGAVVWTGTLELKSPLKYTLHTVFSEARVQEFWNLPNDLTLTTTGTLDLSGALLDATPARGLARVVDLHGTWRQAVLRNAAPVVLLLDKDVITSQHGEPVILRGPNLQVELRGSATGAGLDVRLAAHGDMGLLTAMYPAITTARGPFTLQLGVHGPWHQPALAGEGSMQQVSMHLSQSDQSIDKLRARVVFAGRGMEVSRGSAQVGDGHVTFGGDTVWSADDAPPRFNLQASLHRIRLRPVDNLESTMSGDLQLQGPLNDLQLKGKLKIDALRYTARLDLDRLIPKRNAQPLRVSGLSQVPPVHLAVKLQGSNNIIISSSVLEAELQADLTLTGTSERLGVLGNVAPLWARARYRDNVFKVTRATVDFVDEYRMVVEFNVQAETRACNLLADVTVQGNSDGYTVTAQGQDEHGAVDPQDVLSCLQFGLRLHDFAGNQRAPAGVSDALPGSLDALWTVSGMDDKVKKLLPIDVDELRLTSGWSSLSQRTTARVLVGKELGNGVALKYSRSIDEYNDQSLSIEYRLTQRTALVGTWVSARDMPVGDLGVDVRLRWEKP